MNRHITAAALTAATLLTACGGGGGGDSAPAASGSTSLSGVATKGPLKNAVVTAYKVASDGTVGAEIAHVTTSATDGSYTLPLGDYAGAVQLVVTTTSATVTKDEASGNDVTLPTNFTLHANTVVNAATGSTVQNASITPYTELAHNIAKDSGGLTAANIANANGAVFKLIGVDPVATKPLDVTATPPSTASEAEKRYALLNAAISKLASSTPTTSDTTTTDCFTTAGTDLGKKIQCATQQIATAATVTPGTQNAVSLNTKLDGLSAALLAIASDTNINKTGAVITAEDSVAQVIAHAEDAAASGTPVAITPAPITQASTDIASAKLFFSNLRANATALRGGALGTGVTDGLKAFGDSLSGESSSITMSTLQAIQMVDTARTLWTAYTSGATQSTNSPSVPGTFIACTVYQGTFPTSLGPTDGTPFVSNSVPATSPSAARWVGCSVSSGPLINNGPTRYRQTLLFNVAADPTLAAIPYTGISRAQSRENGTDRLRNLSAPVSGSVGLTLANDEIQGFSMVGDLPPAAAADGTLLAARYPVNIAGQLSADASGGTKLTLNHGSLGVVPVGGTTAGLTIDLSVDGASGGVIANDFTSATQRAASKLTLAASVSDSHGRLRGTLVFDQFALDAASELVIGHTKFTGDIGVVPVTEGTAGTLTTVFTGSLDVTNAATSVVGFSGTMTLPGRPTANLTASVSEVRATGAMTLEGRYEQGTTVVTITGTKASPTASASATFADSSGVSTTVTSHTSKSNVTVGGRQTAEIDKGTGRITYSDGSFETLL